MNSTKINVINNFEIQHTEIITLLSVKVRQNSLLNPSVHCYTVQHVILVLYKYTLKY
jgi:hypothetical protein